MRKAHLLSTAAAALLLAAGAASAQELKQNTPPERAPAAQQRAPAEKIAPNMHAGDRKAPETTGQATHPDTALSPSSGRSETDIKSGAKANAADEKTGAKASGSAATNDKTGKSATESKDAAKSSQPGANVNESASTKTNATTGQGAAAGAAKLSTEQRSKISSIIHQHKTPSVQLNVSVSVGTRVPPSVHLYPLPVQVIEIYPEWRGYDYVMVGEQIIVIDPASHEIVAIIEA